MSYEDWLHSKRDESAHNEILALLMVVLGMNLLIGGLIMTTLITGEPKVFPFFIEQPTSASTALCFILTVTGYLVVSAGLIFVVHYDRGRSWYAGEIEKATIHKKKGISVTIDKLLKEYNRKSNGS